MNHSTAPLLPIAICLMTGIAIARWWMPGFPLPIVLLATMVVALATYRWPGVQSMSIYVCCMMLGMTLMQLRHDVSDDELLNRELEAVVMSEPAERPKTIGVDLLVPKAGGRTLRCYLWKDELSGEIRLGDELVVRGEASRQGSAPLFFIERNNWHPGGKALNQLSRWQRLRLWFLKQRHKLLEHYQDFNAEADTYAVLAAMTLGDKSAQTQELRETYAVSGAAHVLAISGLHVGIVYMLITFFMFGRRRFWLSQVLTVSAIWAFALLTGLSPSVTRAATMISIYAVFSARGGRASGVNVLCFAAIVILVADVRSLFDVGFQLSFASVLAILAFMPLLQGLYQPQNILLRWTWNLGLLSVCAQLGVAPLITYYFGRISIYFLLSNFLVIPAATLILYGSLISLLFPPASIVVIHIVKAMNGGLRIIASLPGASIEGLHPTPLQVALIYVLILLCYLIFRKLISFFRSSINMHDRRWLSPRG